MSAVTYHGEYPEGQVNEDGKRYIVQYDETFVEGKSVNVTDKNLVAKLAANRYFKTEGSDKDAVEQGKEEADKAEAEAIRARLAEDGINPHHKLGLPALRKLRDEHEALKAEASEG
jgi:hypothetical protein